MCAVSYGRYRLLVVSIFTEYDFMLLCLYQQFLLVCKGCQYEVQGILMLQGNKHVCFGIKNCL